jgi:hypothetical protein
MQPTDHTDPAPLAALPGQTDTEHPSERGIPMANTSSANGRTQRKSLAEQIDRLDAILDGLADGINDTVVAAVQEAVQGAVQVAVRTAVVEVLTNEELRRRLQPAAALNAAPTGSLARRLVGKARTFLGGLLQLLAAGCASAAAAFRKAWVRGTEVLGARSGTARMRAAAACGRVTSAARRLWTKAVALKCLAGRFRRPVLVALGVGSAAGVLAYFLGPWAAAVAGWLSGFVTTLAVQAGVALRKLLGPPTVGT